MIKLMKLPIFVICMFAVALILIAGLLTWLIIQKDSLFGWGMLIGFQVQDWYDNNLL